MLHLQHISKSYRDQPVLDDVNLSINPGEVIALIGENGAGKTTLLRIILGELEPDSGSVSNTHEVVGYMPQESDLDKTISASFSADTPHWRRDQVLEAAGLPTVDLDRSVSSLSGGQKTRLSLARVLAHDPPPTVLLLDEPTNNLDSEGLVWLEKFIQNFPGGVLLVTHDRAFINTIATKVANLDKGCAHIYGGNYDFYRTQRQLEEQSELDHYQESIQEKVRLKRERNQKANYMHQTANECFDKVKHESHMAFGGAKNAAEKNLGKQLRALDSRIDHLEDIGRPEQAKQYDVNLEGETHHTRQLLRLENVSKKFKQPILREVSLQINGQERVHIAGANGSGKTTLLKLAAGLMKADSGEVTRGENVQIGYFSQDIYGLDPSKTGRENLLTVTSDLTKVHREARSLGLTEEDLKKKPDELSRGQQAKLAFAKLLLDSNHLLILDEPTNHLDIPTRESLEAALSRYHGAILVASHDSYFIATLGIDVTFHLNNGHLVKE